MAHQEGSLSRAEDRHGGAASFEHQRLDAILVRGTQMLREVAGWNAATVQRLAAAGQVYVPGRTLTGDQVTDHPDLAAAKLAGRHVPAQPEHLRSLLTAYTAARDQAAAFRPGTPGLGAAGAIHRAAGR